MKRAFAGSLAVLCTSLSLACGDAAEEADTATVDTTATVATEPAGMAMPAGMAGNWNVRVMEQASDSTILEYVLTATDNDAGWSLTFPGRDPIPLRVVSAAGDSVVTEAGPYESALRSAVMVRTSSVFRVNGDQLTGTTTARYETTDADSVRQLRSAGTRAQ